jgi:hypothetical protein
MQRTERDSETWDDLEVDDKVMFSNVELSGWTCNTKSLSSGRKDVEAKTSLPAHVQV